VWCCRLSYSLLYLLYPLTFCILYTLFSLLYTLYPTPFLIPYTKHPIPYTKHPIPYTQHPIPYPLSFIAMNDSPQFNLTYLLSVFYRRKGVIIACFLVVSSLTAYLAANLPNIYQSTTLILITPQKLPSSYINSTVTMSIQERISTITQEILSRTRLEKIIRELNLNLFNRQAGTIEEQVNKLRKNIRIKSKQRDNSFRLSYESEYPEEAQRVVARLASLFIEENLRLREQRAIGTTVFIKAEGERLLKEVEKQEAEVNLYRAKHRYELPEQLPVNLSMLEQFRSQLQSNLLRLSALQERKASEEKLLAETDKKGPQIGKTQDRVGEKILPRWQQLDRMKAQLENLLARYSERHPDVTRLKREIDTLEAGAPISKFETIESGSTAALSTMNPFQQTLLKQIKSLNKEIKSVQSHNERLQKTIATYQKRVDNAPLRSIELAKISRTHGVTLSKYQNLLAKSLESQLSENMERKQKAEQFQVIDPANLPKKPVRPNRMRILLLGLLGGLAAGFGLVFMWENLNTSFKRGDEVEGYTDIPLLATIPAFTTRRSVLEQRRSQVILVVASAGTLAIGIVFIRFLVPLFLL